MEIKSKYYIKTSDIDHVLNDHLIEITKKSKKLYKNTLIFKKRGAYILRLSGPDDLPPINMERLKFVPKKEISKLKLSDSLKKIVKTYDKKNHFIVFVYVDLYGNGKSLCCISKCALIEKDGYKKLKYSQYVYK